MAQATFAGAPPGALRKPEDSANETPEVSGTKSMSISPKETISGLDPEFVIFFGSFLSFPQNFLCFRDVFCFFSEKLTYMLRAEFYFQYSLYLFALK